MLMRNYYAKRKKVQELLNSSLLSIGDFNVRVTVVDKNNLTSEGSWKEVFRDSIGGGVVHDNTNKYFYQITTDNGSCIKSIDFGTDIINGNFILFKDENIIRFDITKLPVEKNNPRSWIVIRV